MILIAGDNIGPPAALRQGRSLTRGGGTTGRIVPPHRRGRDRRAPLPPDGRRTPSRARARRLRPTDGCAGCRPRGRGPRASTQRSVRAGSGLGPPARRKDATGAIDTRRPAGTRRSAALPGNARDRDPSAPGSTRPGRPDRPNRRLLHRPTLAPPIRRRTRRDPRSVGRSHRSRRPAHPRRSTQPPPPCTDRRPAATATHLHRSEPVRGDPASPLAPLRADRPHGGYSRVRPTHAAHRPGSRERATQRSGTAARTPGTRARRVRPASAAA